MRDGTVYQRHSKTCPKTVAGEYARHRCRGTWSLVLDGPRDLQGRRRQVTRGGFATKAAATAALQEERDRLQGSEPGAGRVRMGDYLEQWLAGKRRLRPSTVAVYRIHLDLHLKPALGHLRLDEVRAQHVDALLQALIDEGRLSPATVRRVHATLRAALNGAVRRRLIPYNPALQVELPEERRVQTQVWSPEQVGAFLDATSADPLAALWQLVVMSGVRRGEVVGLAWDDVDVQSSAMRIRQQAVEIAGKVHLSEPKTRSGVRTVPLDALTVAALRRHRSQQAQQRLLAGTSWTDTGFVFTDPLGAMLKPNYVTRVFRNAVVRAGLPVLRLHDLRHTSASLALAAGVPLKVVSDRLGHSTIAITANLYTHVSPPVARDAADAIAGLVPRKKAE